MLVLQFYIWQNNLHCHCPLNMWVLQLAISFPTCWTESDVVSGLPLSSGQRSSRECSMYFESFSMLQLWRIGLTVICVFLHFWRIVGSAPMRRSPFPLPRWLAATSIPRKRFLKACLSFLPPKRTLNNWDRARHSLSRRGGEGASVCVWLSRLSESTLAEQKGWGGAVVVKYWIASTTSRS